MMAAGTLPEIFRKSSPYTVSYDWQDLTQALGYRTYYGACTILAGPTRTYFLTTRSTIDSQGPDKTNTNTAVYTPNDDNGSELDLDFDITFGVPAKVGGGKAYINLTIYLGATDDDDTTITGTIYHYDGSTETSLGTATTPSFDGGASPCYIRVLLVFTLTEKQFSKGDILRVNITTTGTNDYVHIYHDPSSAITQSDKDGRTVGTDLTADIPFKVDV